MLIHEELVSRKVGCYITRGIVNPVVRKLILCVCSNRVFITLVSPYNSVNTMQMTG